MNAITTRELGPDIAFERPLRADAPALQQLIDWIARGASERDRERELPFGVMDQVRRSGLAALRVPEAEGGSGVSLRTLFSVVVRIAAADSNVAHILRNHYVTLERILASPRSERNRRWIAAVADGAILGLAGTELTAKRSGSLEVANTQLVGACDGGYRLNGEKFYSTGALYADYLSIPVLTPEGEAASVLVPSTREGVDRVDDWDGFGQRLTGTGTTRLVDVRIEADELIRAGDADNHRFHYFATIPQLYVTAINAGILQAVVHDAGALVHRRPRSFYHAVAEVAAQDPLVQQVVGELAARAFAGEAIVLAAAQALDDLLAQAELGPDRAREASLRASLQAAKAKLVVDDLVLRSTSQLFEVGGASSARRSENLDRHWRNARTLASHNPSIFKARVLGDYHLNGTLPPNLAFF